MKQTIEVTVADVDENTLASQYLEDVGVGIGVCIVVHGFVLMLMVQLSSWLYARRPGTSGVDGPSRGLVVVCVPLCLQIHFLQRADRGADGLDLTLGVPSLLANGFQRRRQTVQVRECSLKPFLNLGELMTRNIDRIRFT